MKCRVHTAPTLAVVVMMLRIGLWEKYTLNLDRDDTYHTDRETGRGGVGKTSKVKEAKQGNHTSKAASLYLTQNIRTELFLALS